MDEIDKIKMMINNIGSEGYRDGSSTKRGWLYHPLPFPEFNIHAHKNSSNDEYDYIKKDYGLFLNKNILDIGCANGFFSFKLALQGANVTGYEGDKFVCDVNEAVKNYKNIKNVHFINEYFNLATAKKLNCLEFDIIIMLNIHMWIRKQIGKEETFNLMKELSGKTKVIYFQTAHVGSGGMYQVPEMKSLQDIEQYLMAAGFKDLVVLGRNDKWFKRYMIRGTGGKSA